MSYQYKQVQIPVEAKSLIDSAYDIMKSKGGDCLKADLWMKAAKFVLSQEIGCPWDMMPGEIHSTRSYGRLTVLKYNGTHDVNCMFNDTGNICTLSAEKIRNGTVKDKMRPSIFSVGYIGNGDYDAKSMVNGVRIYSVWFNMLARCYNKQTQDANPSYVGCTVCEEWHNFQNFAKWYEENHPGLDGVCHLDKDIKFEGNKIYSPLTCSIVTATENIQKAFAKNYVFYKCGEKISIYNLRAYCIENDLSPSAMAQVACGERKSHKGYAIKD